MVGSDLPWMCAAKQLLVSCWMQEFARQRTALLGVATSTLPIASLPYGEDGKSHDCLSCEVLKSYEEKHGGQKGIVCHRFLRQLVMRLEKRQ